MAVSAANTPDDHILRTKMLKAHALQWNPIYLKKRDTLISLSHSLKHIKVIVHIKTDKEAARTPCKKSEALLSH